MRVAIVHYHLDPGGVTSVIHMASKALQALDVSHVILTSSQHSAPHVRTVRGLEYGPSQPDLTAEVLLSQLRLAATEALNGAPDLWHFHNHSLGKNSLIPALVTQLATDGERILLQIHDLAEQGRPENYSKIAAHTHLYPFSSGIHYAFLNSQDRDLFCDLGLPQQNAHLLPNAVTHPLNPSASPSPLPLLFAPIRGIRRKNLGELVLLAALAPAGTNIAISRAPKNPAALPVHDRWRSFANRYRFPIEFDVVDRYSPSTGASSNFDSWVHHATHFISTSIAEGFGLPILEAIAHQKPFIGRNLPLLSADLATHDIQPGQIYDRILIPADWVDLTLLHDFIVSSLERTYRAYQRQLTSEIIDQVSTSFSTANHLDFGNLPEPIQQAVIEKLLTPSNRSLLLIEINGITQPATTWLNAAIDNRRPAATTDQLAPYSLQTYQTHLQQLYSTLSNSPTGPLQHLSPSKLLTVSLNPENFHFLLTAPESPPTPRPPYRAIIFDIYGTLLIAPPGGVKPDPLADPILRDILREFGHEPQASPSTELHAAVLRHHAAANVPYPEIDLRLLWRELLSLEPGTDVTPLIEALESAWHPTQPMPGANQFIQNIARSGITLGLLSNAQCNTLSSLGPLADLFAPELTILSYQHGIAKPAPDLFQILTDRLAGRGIAPAETLFIGNDPQQDIAPAQAAGYQTALFQGHPTSLRPGPCKPNQIINSWSQFATTL